jgi:hypothetical protein
MKKKLSVRIEDMLLLLDFGFAELLVLNDSKFEENQIIEAYCITDAGAKIKRSTIVVRATPNFCSSTMHKYWNLRLKMH